MIWKKESATTKAVIIQMKTDKLFYRVIGILTVFRRTGELKKGDQLKVLLPYGSFSYEIDKTKIVDKKIRLLLPCSITKRSSF